LGSTRIAFQMPSRLDSTEIASTMAASCSRSCSVRTTRRGKPGKELLPDEIGDPVAEPAQGEGLLQDQAENHAVRRADQLEQGDECSLSSVSV
jgi:hypothetical protein